MKIDKSVGKKSTTLKWQHLGEKVSIRLPSRVDAIYSDSKDFIISAGTDGVVRLINLDGSVASDFSYDNTENCKLYILEKSPLTDLGVTMVMAHDPAYEGERFWQHEIDIKAKKITGPICKWR